MSILEQRFPQRNDSPRGGVFFLCESPLVVPLGESGEFRVAASTVHAAIRNSGRSHPSLKTQGAAFGLHDHGESAAMGFSDAARILLPFRTHRGLFCWLTSPSLLGEICSGLEKAGLTAPPPLPTIDDGDALCCTQSFCTLEGRIGVEDVVLPVREDGGALAWAEWLAQFAFPHSEGLKWWREKLLRDLVLVSDTMLGLLSSRSAVTVVHAGTPSHNYCAPENSLFFAGVSSHSSSSDWGAVSGALQHLKVARVGADRSNGYGVCRTKWVL